MYNSGYYGDYGAYNSGVGALFGGMFAALIIFWIVMMIICIGFAVIKIIGQWKMFNKAGEEGWKAIIPVYNQITLCNIVGITPWWILIVFCLSLLSMIPFLGIIFSLVEMAAAVYFVIILNVSVARSYGKSDTFAVGLILLSPVFYFILGISKTDEFVGAKPMDDPVWEWLKKTFNGGTGASTPAANTTIASEAKVEEVKTVKCSECGADVPEKTKFCPECGKEMKGKK